MKFTKVDIERLEYITERIGIKNMDEFEKFLARGFDLDQRWEFLGRPKTITEEQEEEVIRMKAAGHTIAAIAAAVKISGSSVKNIIRADRDRLSDGLFVEIRRSCRARRREILAVFRGSKGVAQAISRK